ncbi:MAG: amino acid ABC transporter ATP-binding protein [Tenericutes bacterium]|nr:amino acid ABC transporter ATP-binding protein [Mycoplasmatota bacterium]
MLEVKDLKKNFGKTEVIKGISFDVQKGEVVAIIGPSGCGKSTMLRCLNMLEKPTSGKIILDNEDITGEKVDLTKIREKMGMVFQQFNLFPHLTVLENITVAPLNLKLLTKEEATKKALELLKSIGLEDKKDNYPNELSGGQKQRVAIIRTLMMNPEIILFDEPTSALDPEMVGEVLTLIKTLVDKKNTIIIVSHEMEFIKNCATKVLFLDEGKIAYSGTPQKVFSTKDCPRLTEFLSKTSYK